MKDFCNVIKLYSPDDILSIQGNVITAKKEHSPVILHCDDFSITPNEQTNESGTLYRVEEDITVDKVDQGIASTFKIRRSYIVELLLYPGNENRIIGSLEYPAKVSITTHLNKDTLHIQAKMRQSPL